MTSRVSRRALIAAGGGLLMWGFVPRRVARASWWTRWLGWTHVRDYGTDRAAIHAARDAAGPNGTVYFEPGTYLVDWDVEASVAGQRWIVSRDATIRRASGTVDQWSMGVVRVKASGVRIEGAGTIDANRAGNDPAYAIACVIAERQNDMTLQDLTLVNSHGTAAVAYSDGWGASNNATFRRLRIRACPSGIGWIWGAASGGTAEDNDLLLDGGYANGIGANTGVTGLTIRDNQIRGAGRFGIELWRDCDGSLVEGNTVTGPCEIGYSVVHSDGVTLRDNLVTDASYAGYEVGGAGQVLVEQCESDRCGIGVMVDDGAATVRGNTLRDSQRAVMTLNAADVLIEANMLAGWSGGHAPSAVYVQSSQRVTIEGNDLSDGPGACIAVDNSHDVNVTGNTYHDLDGPFAVWTWGAVTGLVVEQNRAV